MKKMLLAIFSALCFGASAQITVTAATFPTAGDTLRFAVDTTVGDISLAVTPPGANQLWDFTGLQPASTFTTVYRPAASGMNFGSFPGAELLVLNQQGETYFNVTNNVVENMGYSGNDPVNLNLDVLAKFQPRIFGSAPPTPEKSKLMCCLASTLSETRKGPSTASAYRYEVS